MTAMTAMTARMFGLLLLLTLTACSRHDAMWEEAQEEDTVAAYEAYLERYPETEQARHAERRIVTLNRERDWREARERGTVAAYRAFLDAHPETDQADSARDRLAALEREQAWRELERSDNADALQRFARRHAGTPEAGLARERLAELEAREQVEAEAEAEAEAHREREATQAAERGTHRVQLAAVGSEDRARAGMERLQSTHAEVLGDVRLETQAANNMYRLLTGPMSREQANALCESLKARDQDCIVRAK